MRDMLPNMKVNFLLYLRSKLILVMSIIFGGLIIISFLIAFARINPTMAFSSVKYLLGFFDFFTNVFVITLVLVGISNPLGSRSIKMILTKPCRPEYWILSNYCAALVVGLFFVLLSFIGVVAYFFAGDMAIQWGFLYILIHNVLMLMLRTAFAVFIAVVLHPVVAGIVVILGLDLFAGFFTSVFITLSNVTEAFSKVLSAVFSSLRYIFQSVYYVLPDVHPFADKTKNTVYASLKVASGDWLYLGYTSLYMLLGVVLFLFTANVFFKRKNII